MNEIVLELLGYMNDKLAYDSNSPVNWPYHSRIENDGLHEIIQKNIKEAWEGPRPPFCFETVLASYLPRKLLADLDGDMAIPV